MTSSGPDPLPAHPFARFIEAEPDRAVLILANDGSVTHCNIGVERLLGWRAADLVGKSAILLYPPAPDAENQFKKDQIKYG